MLMYANVVSSDDVDPPKVTCPQNITQYVVPGITSVNVTFLNATATDNSGIASFVNVSQTSGSLFLLGTTEVRFVFEDPSGNLGTCKFSVTVNDTACKLENFIFLYNPYDLCILDINAIFSHLYRIP